MKSSWELFLQQKILILNHLYLRKKIFSLTPVEKKKITQGLKHKKLLSTIHSEKNSQNIFLKIQAYLTQFFSVPFRLCSVKSRQNIHFQICFFTPLAIPDFLALHTEQFLSGGNTSFKKILFKRLPCLRKASSKQTNKIRKKAK